MNGQSPFEEAGFGTPRHRILQATSGQTRNMTLSFTVVGITTKQESTLEVYVGMGMEEIGPLAGAIA